MHETYNHTGNKTECSGNNIDSYSHCGLLHFPFCSVFFLPSSLPAFLSQFPSYFCVPAKLISRRTCDPPPPLAEHRDHGKGAPRVLGEPYRGHNRTETLSSASAPSPHSASSIFILLETSPRRPDHRSDFPSFQPTGPTHVSGALVVTSPSGSQPPLDALMAEVSSGPGHQCLWLWSSQSGILQLGPTLLFR